MTTRRPRRWQTPIPRLSSARLRANEAGANWATMNAINQAGGGGVVEPGPIPEVGPSTHCHGAAQAGCCEAISAWPVPSGKFSSSARQRRRWNKEKGGWQVREYRVSIAALEHPGARFVEQLLLLPPKSLTVSFRRCRSASSPGAQCAMHQVLQVTSWPP